MTNIKVLVNTARQKELKIPLESRHDGASITSLRFENDYELTNLYLRYRDNYVICSYRHALPPCVTAYDANGHHILYGRVSNPSSAHTELKIAQSSPPISIMVVGTVFKIFRFSLLNVFMGI